MEDHGSPRVPDPLGTPEPWFWTPFLHSAEAPFASFEFAMTSGGVGHSNDDLECLVAEHVSLRSGEQDNNIAEVFRSFLILFYNTSLIYSARNTPVTRSYRHKKL
jgi:hypothetical protein